MSKKIGLFFGSFNPIHIGHLIIANTMLEYTPLNEIWFVLSPQNPFKENSSLLNENCRLQMLELAIKDNLNFKVCTAEFNLSKPSYTIHTLEYLTSNYLSFEFSIIMGSDNLENIDKWKEYEKIIEKHNIYVYSRPNHNGGKFINHTNITLVQAPLLEISSEFIRNAIQQKKSVKYLISETVLHCLENNKFYN